MNKSINLIESFSEGKVKGKNDDALYFGENFVAVIDGVSHKSSVMVNGEEVKIANIIFEALKKIDEKNMPVSDENNGNSDNESKKITFENMVKWINNYIKNYLIEHGLESEVGKMEATAAIYSKYHNQIWIVGDCRAIYDGTIVLNPLKIDDIYIKVRNLLIAELQRLGYKEAALLKRDIAKEIIEDPKLLDKYFGEEAAKIEYDWKQIIVKALWESGFLGKDSLEFSEDKIDKYIEMYINPRNLQKMVKNIGKILGGYGYSVFNGRDTDLKNCKVVDLPEGVKNIILSTDGFPIDALQEGGIEAAKEARHGRAAEDPLSIGVNSATHSSKFYDGEGTPRSTDDATAVEIEVTWEQERTNYDNVKEKNKNPEDR